MKTKQHCSELTVMSGIAILFVLGIHGCGSVLSAFHTETMGYADADIWVRTLSNFVAPAVPMFLFVSGYKYALNDSETPYIVFLRKRLPRVLMSFALINTFFWALDSMKYMESFDAVLLAKTYLHSWVGYSVAYQLWYIPMYCFVLAFCPLVRRMISSTSIRFCIFAVFGIIQRLLETEIPVLATYPIRFVSYPVFFEMGVLACESKFRERITQTAGFLVAGYILGIVLLSWMMPIASTSGLTKYLGYYFVGTIVFYILSVWCRKSRIFQWIGTLSYPIFLLHEPFIGKVLTKTLAYFPIKDIFFVICWVIIDFAVSYLMVVVIKWLKVDKILWNFRLPEMK